MQKEEVEEQDEYDSEYDSEYDTDSESEASETNEGHFNKLLELRVQSTDFQLDAFCAKYIFVLKQDGVKIVHNLADEFDNLCKEIYEPLLKKASPRRKGTLRRNTNPMVSTTRLKSKLDLKIPSELPTQHAKVQRFFNSNEIKFDTEAEQEKVFHGLHVGDSCCFLQFLLLKFREMIVHQHLTRWEKTKEDIEKKNLGSIILEEYFMPPMNVEPKLDKELVKFSNLMQTRQLKITEFERKMAKKDPKSVAYNILKTEMNKYKKELVEKINVSQIYFAAAIMRVKQKQRAELEKIYDIIEEEEKQMFQRESDDWESDFSEGIIE